MIEDEARRPSMYPCFSRGRAPKGGVHGGFPGLNTQGLSGGRYNVVFEGSRSDSVK